MNNPLSSLSRRQLGVLVTITLAIAGITVSLIISQGSVPAHHLIASTTPTVPISQSRAVTSRCPLTDLPARRGVPNRPALLVKIGNEPSGARPQSGLNEADIVFDTPAEGFIMRYIAVYQCDNAASIGPTRSLRWVDWHLAREFIHPILAFAGGINPNVDQVRKIRWLDSANLLAGAQGATYRTSKRLPPDNLYTSTAALYQLFPGRTARPHPVFEFLTKVPRGGIRASRLSIDFSYGTDVIWKWEPKRAVWLHTYGGVPDIDALTGKPVVAKNVVVLVVSYTFGPYIESPGGSGDFESQTLGRGVGYVFRNGVSIKITWRRKFLIDPFSFTRANGEIVTLAPGHTWVEIVPERTPMAFMR